MNLGILKSLVFVILVSCNASGSYKNGFELLPANINVEQILQGGPPKDGIPAIEKPRFLAPRKADFLDNDDEVIGIKINGVSKAYPIKILNWHEVVNDKVGEQHFVITYCPLCRSGAAFFTDIEDDEDNEFYVLGVSGLLYNNNMLMYDKKTESLWSQILGRAVTGKLINTQLKRISVTHTSWRQWKGENPRTLVLSTETGFPRNYLKNPYRGYAYSKQVYFPLSEKSDLYHPKELVLGVQIDGTYKAYPFSELEKNQKASFIDEIDDQMYTIRWDEKNQIAKIFDNQRRELDSMILYWFSWYAFFPKTKVFEVVED